MSSPAGVEFTGIVPDIELLYGRTRVVCCPLTNGGGTRVKLIEAAAYAKPIVSTTMGAEGLAFTDGNNILIRERDADIADACVQLLEDDAQCSTLGAAAYRLATTAYDRQAVKTLIMRESRSVLGAAGAPNQLTSRINTKH
jgi:glycosyltransferase involved in cell wall biosynthesis